MTGRTVRRVGEEALKSLQAQSAEDGRRLAALSEVLRSNGLNTPLQTYDGASHASRMAWIDGVGGPETIDRLAGSLSDHAAVSKLLSQIIDPVVRLHRIDGKGLGLGDFDHRPKITARLKRCMAENAPGADRLANAYDCLEERFSRFHRFSGLDGTGLIHGDFHVGQVIVERGTDIPWLIDLDDMALGLPEADLGNFVAHLATSPQCRFDHVSRGYEFWRLAVGPVYAGLAGRPVDEIAFALYAVAALLRRGLKLFEGGSNEIRLDEIATAVKAAMDPLGPNKSA